MTCARSLGMVVIAFVALTHGVVSTATADEYSAVKPKPPPYSVAWQLRSPSAGNSVRSDTAVATFDAAEGSGLTVVSALSASYKVTPTLAPSIRVAFIHNAPPMGEAAEAMSNPVVGVTWAPPSAVPSRKVAFFAGVTIPIGTGGGNGGDVAMLGANKAAVAARSGMDNALFAINDTAVSVGVDLAYIADGLTVQAEATVLEAIRVRGDQVQADATKTNLTSGLHAGYFVLDFLSIGAELRYQRYLSTPSFVAATPTNRDNLSVAAGLRAHFDLGDKRWLRPGIAYARGLDDPMTGAGYSVVQVDVPFAF